MNYKLFVTKFCHKCPSLKEYMQGQDKVEGSVVDASTPEGMEEAKKLNVTMVPTIVFFDNDEEVKRCSSKEEVEDFLNNI